MLQTYPIANLRIKVVSNFRNKMRTCYDQVVGQTNDSAAQSVDNPCAMATQVGDHYDREWMVVGRATNGWDNDLDDRERDLDKDPMLEFVEDNAASYLRRSAFWRVVSTLAIEGRRDFKAFADDPENSVLRTLAWSNLYRIAPSQGNPTEWMKKLQKQACKEILMDDIKLLRPKRLLLLSGKGWAEGVLPDMDEVHSNMPQSRRFVDQCGFLEARAIRCVVACHPQSRPEAEWVTEVRSGFEALA